MKEYPALKWVVKHGRQLALSVLALGIAVGIYAYMRTGVIELAVAGTILGSGGFAVVRVGTEVIELISDMLMPQ